ncbi:sulfite exporter TauE/SafE family protein [soil metagenome]
MLQTYLLLCGSAFLAGAVNSIAGGGTLLTFPALMAVVPAVAANATSTFALVPGSMAGAWAYRREMGASRKWAWLLLLPSIVGGFIGTLLVTNLDDKYFEDSVPYLILLATLLFMSQPVLSRWVGVGAHHSSPSKGTLAAIIGFQFLVAIYGGYFGAGIGILMLSALSLMGFDDIHKMNALKTLLAAVINTVSVLLFIGFGKVVWEYGLVMAVAAIAGGYAGASSARRMNRAVVRWIVIGIGLTLSAYYFAKQVGWVS